MPIYQIGEKVSRYTVLERIRERGTKTKTYYRCICECGTEKTVRASVLGVTTFSCGCLNKELSAARVVKMNTKHGKSRTPIYTIWNHMVERCYKEYSSRYKNYGARGIKVCEEWLEASKFINWAYSNGYKEGLSLERVDVNGNYEPSNCKFIELKYQARNKVNTVWLEYNGSKITIPELSELSGISQSCIYKRHLRGKKNDELIKPMMITKKTPR